MISKLSNFSGPISSFSTYDVYSFRYYKFTISGVVGGPSNIVQIGEFRFLTNGLTQSMSGVSVSNPPDNGNSPSEGIDKIIDGYLSTKWLNNTGMVSDGQTSIYFDFGSKYYFNSYNWSTANDSNVYPERTPTSWSLYGSNDNINWITLHVINSYTPDNTPYTWQTEQVF